MTDSPRLPGKILTMEEILHGLSDLAENGDGAQRAQAYRMLLGQGQTQTAIPEMLEEHQIVAKLRMLMRAAGPDLCRVAYYKAFPNKAGDIDDTVSLGLHQVDLPDGFNFPKTLRTFYRMFPELRGPGMPKGFPQRRSLAVKAEWFKEQTLKILRDRQQKTMIKEEAPKDGDAPGSNTEEAVQAG